jgi:hypothetical protein
MSSKQPTRKKPTTALKLRRANQKIRELDALIKNFKMRSDREALLSNLCGLWETAARERLYAIEQVHDLLDSLPGATPRKLAIVTSLASRVASSLGMKP